MTWDSECVKAAGENQRRPKLPGEWSEDGGENGATICRDWEAVCAGRAKFLPARGRNWGSGRLCRREQQLGGPRGSTWHKQSFRSSRQWEIRSEMQHREIRGPLEMPGSSILWAPYADRRQGEGQDASTTPRLKADSKEGCVQETGEQSLTRTGLSPEISLLPWWCGHWGGLSASDG